MMPQYASPPKSKLSSENAATVVANAAAAETFLTTIIWLSELELAGLSGCESKPFAEYITLAPFGRGFRASMLAFSTRKNAKVTRIVYDSPRAIVA